jgi:hypothetical protein
VSDGELGLAVGAFEAFLSGDVDGAKSRLAQLTSEELGKVKLASTEFHQLAHHVYRMLAKGIDPTQI